MWEKINIVLHVAVSALFTVFQTLLVLVAWMYQQFLERTIASLAL